MRKTTRRLMVVVGLGVMLGCTAGETPQDVAQVNGDTTVAQPRSRQRELRFDVEGTVRISTGLVRDVLATVITVSRAQGSELLGIAVIQHGSVFRPDDVLNLATAGTVIYDGTVLRVSAASGEKWTFTPSVEATRAEETARLVRVTDIRSYKAGSPQLTHERLLADMKMALL